MLKKGGAREEVCSGLAKRGLNSSAAPEEIWPGLTEARPSPARKLPRSATTAQARAAVRRSAAKGARLRTRGSAIRHAASYPTRMRKSSPTATRSFCSSTPNERRNCIPSPPPFPGRDYRLSGLAHAGLWFRASGGRTRDASKKKKRAAQGRPGCAWQPAQASFVLPATARSSC
jgi:hypothetical protein